MPANTDTQVTGFTFKANVTTQYAEILTDEALQFIAQLQRKFNSRRFELLELRANRQKEINAGNFPNFLPETQEIRDSEWQVAPLPQDLLDRRVEITGPVDRKMIINALNSGANVFMADCEDSSSPTWNNMLNGQINLRDAVNKTISFTNDHGKKYELNDTIATLMVRPRGWHLNEKHILVDGNEVSGSLFDFGLYFFHNSHTLLKNGSGPYFYLPKLENHLEARLWNDVFVFAQEYMNIPQGTIKATVLIETILASFEMHEILWELREHSAGLNCGRWDYIFSYIKKFAKHADFILPDRSQVTMATHFMKSYSQLLIQTCHKRKVHAMGGMAAQIPVKNNIEANEIAFQKVRADKEREAKDGHDGTWVAHPGLIATAKEVFDTYMKASNQIEKKREDVNITAEDLLKIPTGEITLQGLKTNMDVAIQYLEAWLNGNGCVPIYNLMEDAATAEISRTQVWQWINNSEGKLTDGRKVTIELCQDLLPEVLNTVKNLVGEERYWNGKYETAAKLFMQMIESKELNDFLTLEAYKLI